MNKPFILITVLCAVVGAGCAATSEGEGEGEGESAEGEGEGEGDVDPCAAPLGTLTLGAHFGVSACVAIDENIYQLAPHATNDGFEVFGLTNDLNVFRADAWPDLSDATTLFSALNNNDSDLTPGTEVFPSFIVVGDNYVGTGYSLAADEQFFIGGEVQVTHVDGQAPLARVDAPGNFSAAAVDDTVFINASGVSNVDGNGIYALDLQGNDLIAGMQEDSYVGFTAGTWDGIVVASAFTTQNELVALTPDAIAAARDTQTPSTAFAETPIATGEYGPMCGMAAGIAVVTSPDYVNLGLEYWPLGVNESDSFIVDVGTADTVLSTPDNTASPTTITFVSPMGTDVLVGIVDANGQRAVRIASIVD